MPAGTIALILNLLFVVTLVFGFLIGLWRGVKKASINIVFSLVGLIVAFFVSGVVTNSVLEISVSISGGESMPLKQALVKLLQDDSTVGQIIGANANNIEFIEKLVYALANVIVFLLLAIAIQFVCYILYAILSAIVVKKKDKEGNKFPKHRIAGGVVGIVKTFIVVLFVFMPFNALVGTATNLMSVSNSTSAAEETTETQATTTGTLDVVYNILDGVNTSAYGVIGNMFGLDNAMFDYLSAFQIDNETIYIRQEVANIYDVYSAMSQILSTNKNVKLSKLDFNSLDKAVNSIVNSGLYKKVLVDTLGNIVENYTDYSFIDMNSLGEYGDIIRDISAGLKANEGTYNDYFTNDILKVYEAFKSLAQSEAFDDTSLSTIDIITSLANEHYTSLEGAVKSLFNMNIVRDSTSTVLNLALKQALEGTDQVVVNGREITNEEWETMATQVSQVVKNFANAATEADIFAVINDPLVLLSQDNTADIAKLFDNLGQMIDNVRGIKLFKNQEGNSVLDKVLNDNGFTLPAQTETIYNVDGTEATITNYTELLNYIAPSLVDLKNINVYDLLSTEPISTADVMVTFANAVVNDTSADKDILARIILPLSQVEPTKTMIADKLFSTLTNDLIDFTSVETFADRKSDLKYISNMLAALNKGSIGEAKQTYLQFILTEGNTVEDLFKNLTADSTTPILKPILYAQSTLGLRTQFFTSLGNAFTTILKEDVTFDTTGVTLKEDAENDQTNEICEVFEKLMAFYPTLTSDTDISSLDKIALGQLLDSMKVNAYREGEAGIFANVFDKLANATATLYNIPQDADGSYRSVNFTQVLSGVEAG